MLNKVFITNASLNMIFKSLRNKKVSLSRDEILNHISSEFEDEFVNTSFYDNMHILFNNSELKEIYFESMVFKDFNKTIGDISGNKDLIKEYVDKSNKIYAFKVKEPAYHSINNCTYLNSNFSNIIIPEDCRIGDDLRKKAELWITNMGHLDFDKLNAKFKIEFQCDCELEKISKENSGNLDFENYKVKLKPSDEIKEKFKQLKIFFDSEFAKKINNLKYAASYKVKSILKNDRDIASHESIIEFHSVKDSLRQMIKNHYRSKYNQLLSFDKNLLDSIGFRACRSCADLTI